MRIDIISVVPDLMVSPFSHSIVKRAQEKGLVEIYFHNLRNHGIGEYNAVDDYPYGGGGGMVLRCEPLAACIEPLLKERTYDAVIYMTPDGKVLDQPQTNYFSMMKNVLIICGHYKGIDQRIRDTYITHEVSIGSYVLSGGELAAAVFCDAIIRIIPGVIGDEMSALSDSFQDKLLAPPVYTKPEEWNGLKVPDVLLSGHHKKIDEWRLEQSYEITKQKRPDLLDNNDQ